MPEGVPHICPGEAVAKEEPQGMHLRVKDFEKRPARASNADRSAMAIPT